MIRTRIAPSPTGDPHVGTLYIALFNYVFAKSHNGKFIIRIEDTDQKRSKKIYETNILNALQWANLSWDEGVDIGGEYGPYRQSDRLDIYKKYIDVLLEKNKAYRCFATKEELEEMRATSKSGYDRRYRNLSSDEIQKLLDQKRKYVVRLKVPLDGECVFEDKIKGTITTPMSDIDDQILLKSDGYPTYHFASVIDDHLMKITHVIRGDEWIASTPKHILIYEAFGFEKPIFMHMPLLLGENKKKLSKRKNPTSVFFYRDSGFLPEAMINFLSLMGYSMKNEKEIYSLEELIKEFDPKNFGKSGAFFDITKLKWINQKYIIENFSEKELLDKIKQLYLNDDFLLQIMKLAHSRVKTLGEFFELSDFFFINDIAYTKDLLLPKKIEENLAVFLLHVMVTILDEKDWSSKIFEETAKEVATYFDINYKKIMIPLLFATIMGKKFGPPLFASIEILKRAKTRARFLKAIEFLGGISQKKIKLLKGCLEKKDFSKVK